MPPGCRSGIAYPDLDRVIRPTDCQTDLPVPLRVFRGVRQRVTERLRRPEWIAIHASQLFGQIQAEVVTPFSDQRLHCLHRTGDQAADLDRLP